MRWRDVRSITSTCRSSAGIASRSLTVGSTTVPLGHSSLVVSEEVYRRVVLTLRPPYEANNDNDEPPATD